MLKALAASAYIHDAPTWMWTLFLLSLTWGYLGIQSRRKAAARSGASSRGSSEGLRATDSNNVDVCGVKSTSPAYNCKQIDVVRKSTAVAGDAPSATAVAAAVEVDAALPFEPEPPSDPLMKARMKQLIAGLDEEWAASGPPLLDNGAMRVWHRPDGGSVHSFKYEVVMPLGPEPCVALAKELDLMPTWHKFVPTGTVLAPRPGIFGGIYAYATMWMPWPMKHRGILCQSAFFDCLDDPALNAYIVHVSSLKRPSPPLPHQSTCQPDDTTDEDDETKACSPSPSGSSVTSGSSSSSSCEGAHSAATHANAQQQELQEHQERAAEIDRVIAMVPTSEDECPRMHFESYTTFRPLPKDPVTGNARTVWCLYFDRTDYQFELPAFVLGFLMKVCAPFVLTVAVGLAKAVPQHYLDRIARDEHFYGPLGRRCRQKAHALETAAAAAATNAAAAAAAPGSGASGQGPRRQGATSLKRASLAKPPPKPPPKVAGARKAAQRSNSLLDLCDMEREQEALYSPRPKAPLNNTFSTASPGRKQYNGSSQSHQHNGLKSPKTSSSAYAGSKDEPGFHDSAESDVENHVTPLSQNQITTRESCLF